MNKFKKVIFPFGDKYDQLNNKWRHRLLKVLYAISIVLFSIGTLSYINSELSIPSFENTLENKIVTEKIAYRENILWDFITNVNEWDNYDIIKAKYPELKGLDEEGISQLIANIDQGDNTQTILKKFPELESIDYIQSIKTLKQTINTSDSLEDIRGMFPEFNHLDDKVLLDLIATTRNNEDLDDILGAFPELTILVSSPEPTRLINYIIYYLEYMFLFIISILLYNFIVQFLYYKWIIYIIYGNKLSK